MDHLAHLRRLHKYESWATLRILDSLSGMDNAPQLALEQLGHVLAARLAWLTRLQQGHSDEIDIWPLLGIDDLCNLHKETMAALTALLDGIDPATLAEVVPYRSYGGGNYTDSLADILLHVVNHASHHRGIILRSIREAGGTAPACDWIVFTRS